MTNPHRVVTLLTQSDCHLCEHAKTVLARVSVDFPIEVDEVSLSTETGERLATEMGILFAPGVLLDGKPFGFGRISEKKLRKALAASRT